LLMMARRPSCELNAETPRFPPMGNRPPAAMTEAEREKYVTWWLYESGLDVDELIEMATMLL
jgi:hypothetical protein